MNHKLFLAISLSTLFHYIYCIIVQKSNLLNQFKSKYLVFLTSSKRVFGTKVLLFGMIVLSLSFKIFNKNLSYKVFLCSYFLKKDFFSSFLNSNLDSDNPSKELQLFNNENNSSNPRYIRT